MEVQHFKSHLTFLNRVNMYAKSWLDLFEFPLVSILFLQMVDMVEVMVMVMGLIGIAEVPPFTSLYPNSILLVWILLFFAWNYRNLTWLLLRWKQITIESDTVKKIVMHMRTQGEAQTMNLEEILNMTQDRYLFNALLPLFNLNFCTVFSCIMGICLHCAIYDIGTSLGLSIGQQNREEWKYILHFSVFVRWWERIQDPIFCFFAKNVRHIIIVYSLTFLSMHRRRIHVSGRAVTLMMRRMMIGSGGLNGSNGIFCWHTSSWMENNSCCTNMGGSYGVLATTLKQWIFVW